MLRHPRSSTLSGDHFPCPRDQFYLQIGQLSTPTSPSGEWKTTDKEAVMGDRGGKKDKDKNKIKLAKKREDKVAKTKERSTKKIP